MKRDTHNTEQVYYCDDCQTHHQESTVAVKEEIVAGHVSRTMYCDVCQSDDLRLLTEDDAVDHGRRQGEAAAAQVQTQTQTG